MKSEHWQYGALIVAGLCTAAPLITQAADAPLPGADTLEEVVVTAQRRAEPILDVPLSISVISAADIERLHATNLRDLEAAAPGFTISPGGSPGQAEIIIRGLTTLAGGSAVANLIDDVAVGSSASWADTLALDMLPYDIARIEILSGPQGTLYGANSLAGALKYVTKDPNLTASEVHLGGEVFGIKDGGSVGSGVRGTWSAPLIDGVLAIRASLYDQETPGYIRNPTRGLNHENTLSQYGGRLALLWQPAPELQVKLQGIYQRLNSAGNAIIFADVLGTAQDPYYRPGNWYFGDLIYPHAVPEPFSSAVTFVSATLNWHTVLGDFVALTGYSDKDSTTAQDSTGVFLDLDPSIPVRVRFQQGTKKASQEFRLASPSGQRLEWLAGAFYTHEQTWFHLHGDALDNQLNPIPALNPFMEGHNNWTYTEAAVFGTLTYRITDRFDLTGGLRWLTNHQEADRYISPSYSTPADYSKVGSAETPGTYAFSARFHPRPETMTYVRVASGYRPGTPNPAIAGYPEIPPLARSDTTKNYEIGVKSELANRKVAVTLDVFRVNWTDMQISVNTADGRENYVINAGAVTSEGCEFQANYRLSDALQISINGAYTDAFATQAVPAAGIFVGTRLPSSPKWTAAAMVDYRLRDFGHWTPRASATWRYVSSQYTVLSTSTAPPVGLIPAYSWVNVNLQMTRGRYEVALYAKNLFDKRTFNNGGVGGGPDGATFVFGGFTMDPRVVGLSAAMTL